MTTSFIFSLLYTYSYFLAPNLPDHNVWCHGTCGNPKTTLEFYTQAGEVYYLLEEMKEVYRDANTNLEEGVIAEFHFKLDKEQQLKPFKYNNTLEGYIQLRKTMNKFDSAIEALQKINGSCARVKAWDDALEQILKNDAQTIERISYIGKRYSDVSGIKHESMPPITGVTGILEAWRHDLKILQNTLDQVIDGLRNAIPLAEKGDFASVMLSGRNVFGDKNPQFTDMFSAYDRMYVSTVLCTIAATMQAYPAGYEWLKQPTK